MKIINPLYDWAFKYLMDNISVAKKFLSIILKMEVTHLENRNVEVPLLKEGEPFLTRFDFKAIIETEPNRYETVIIEIQKYKSDNPLERFRKYLAENYLRKETFKDSDGNSQTMFLPIVSIYILGFCPSEFKVPYIVVRNESYDGVTEKKLKIDSNYIDLLTHKAYFLIVNPPKEYVWGNKKQEALIRLFRQKTSVEEKNTIYEIDEDRLPEELKDITKHLHRGTLEEWVLKQMDFEEEFYTDMKKVEELSQIVIQKEKELKEEKRRAEEEKRRAEEERLKLIETVKLLKSLGVEWSLISEKTGFSLEEIEKM